MRCIALAALVPLLLQAQPAGSSVVFAEDFEEASLTALSARWNATKNPRGRALALSTDVPEGSGGRQSLRVTATRGENDGGHVFRLLPPGYDRLFLRFYVKFGAENGFNHHFVSLGGEIDPPPYPVGRAGLKPEKTWNSGIEPAAISRNTVPPISYPPPGIWHFYTYWPEMRSWQNPDGTGTSFYGNNFEPETPFAAPRGKWVCVEITLKMNSAPDARDGEQAFWIDGKLAGRFAPGSMTGLWERDNFRRDAGGKKFEGFRWRDDMRVRINKLWLSHYLSEDAFKRTDRYASGHPEFKVDMRTATVWFDDLVVSTEYIGPLKGGK